MLGRPPPPPKRDPRSTPVPGDRLLLKTEGACRIVLEVGTDKVVWRFLGGTVKRTSRPHEWYIEMTSAVLVHLEEAIP